MAIRPSGGTSLPQGNDGSLSAKRRRVITRAGVLPPEILDIIFSFSNSSIDLIHFGCVSLQWSEPLRKGTDQHKKVAEYAYRALSLEKLDNAKAYQDSWEKGHDILKNWPDRVFTRRTTTLGVIECPFPPFAFSKDNTPVVVYSTPNGFVIRNCLTDEVKVLGRGLGQITACDLSETIFSILYDQKNVYRFDILNGKPIKLFEILSIHRDGVIKKLLCSINEITIVDNKTKIFESNTGRLIRSIDESSSCIFSMQNNIICYSESSLTAFHKRDHLLDRSLTEEAMDEIAVSDKYIAYLSYQETGDNSINEIKIYQECQGEIKFQRTIKTTIQPEDNLHLSIYQNWLLVSSDHEDGSLLKVWNMNTGTLFTTIKDEEEDMLFYTDGVHLLALGVGENGHYFFTLYDFRS